MRILITGDRNWNDYSFIKRILIDYFETNNLQPNKIELIHGNAKGADRMGALAALSYGIPSDNIISVEAKWSLYGRGAGPKRNREMLNLQPDIVLAFHSNIENSKGTKDCLTEAKRRGIPHILWIGETK